MDTVVLKKQDMTRRLAAAVIAVVLYCCSTCDFECADGSKAADS